MDIDGIIQYFDLNTFLSSEYNNDNTFVIGGGKLYKDLLPFIDTIFLTEVDLIKEADTFFPDISGMFIKKSSNKVIENDIVLDFCEYVRRN